MVSGVDPCLGMDLCWLWQVAESIWIVATTLAEIGVKLAPIFGTLYMLFWVWLIIKTVKTGSPEPILNHILALWHILGSLFNALVSVVGWFRR